jgi:hypothetical protein
MILNLWVRISSNILDGNGVKSMPDSIFGTQFGFKNDNKKKNLGSQMGHTEKIFFLSAVDFIPLQKQIFMPPICLTLVFEDCVI